MEQFVIDSNVIIDYLLGKLPQKGMSFVTDIIDSTPIISVMTKIEVLGFKNSASDDLVLNELILSSVIVDLTDEIIDCTIQLRKNYKIKVPDAIIASTAIILDMPLITRNTSDFKSMPQVRLVNPWEV